jgi:hypothetical protein
LGKSIGGTRLVADGAHNFCQRAADPTTNNDPLIQKLTDLKKELLNGKIYPELIAAESKDGSLIIIEGHHRSTAYVIAQRFDNIEALVASSASMSMWNFY